MNRDSEFRRPAHVENGLPEIQALVDLFDRQQTCRLIANLEVKLDVLTTGDQHFPVSFNEAKQVPNCYICCPSVAYIDYAIDETRNFAANPALKRAIKTLVATCAPLVRASGLDEQVQINNWLFSTNPLPELQSPAMEKMVARLTQDHPGRAIVIRSLNDLADRQSIAVLKALGFSMLPMRQVYVFRPGRATAKQIRVIRKDNKLISEQGLHFVEDANFTEADFKRCEDLYNMLYLEKYTPLNPQYTATYIREMRDRGLLKLAGARDFDGRLVTVTGLFENGTTLTQPIVGYDTTLPQEIGLYRIAMSIAQQYAMRHDMFFNMSAGAANFKRNRGAEPVIEYMAVYNRHLSRRKRLATAIIGSVLSRVGVPLLKRFEL